MTILNLLQEPDPRLRKKSLKVEKVDSEILKIMDDMLETMYHDNGIGLAAPQVNIHKRIIVIDARESLTEEELEQTEHLYPLFMVNPEIFWYSKETISADEGCLSVPTQYVSVTRPSGIKVRYIDRSGEEKIIENNQWLARVIQHESDHLDGKLIIDYVSKLKRDIIINKLTKLKNNEKNSTDNRIN